MRRRSSHRRRITVLIADQAGVFRFGLKKLFGLEDDLRVVAQAENSNQVVAMAKSFRPNLLFVQSTLLTDDLFDLIRKHASESKMVVMTSDAVEDEAPRHVRSGASGVIVKSVAPQSFVKCARKVMDGDIWMPKAQRPHLSEVQGGRGQPIRPADTLTRREKTIISHLTLGWRNREIANELSITEQTVKNHLRSIYDKVGVSDRLELVLYAIHQHLELPPVAGAVAAP